jgi:hypothetical protein
LALQLLVAYIFGMIEVSLTNSLDANSQAIFKPARDKADKLNELVPTKDMQNYNQMIADNPGAIDAIFLRVRSVVSL